MGPLINEQQLNTVMSYVEIGNKDADGHVIIDAVQWLPAGD